MSMKRPRNTFCGQVNRREAIRHLGGGFTSLALTGMLAQDGFFNRAGAAANSYANPLAPKEPMLPARAKSVIFLFMYGGPSHMDTFEYKPEALPARRQDHQGEDLRPRREEEQGPRGGSQVAVQAVRPVRQARLRPLPAPRPTRGRHRLHPLHDGRLPDSRLGHAHDELRLGHQRQAVDGILGQLRSRKRERGPAGLRRDARQDRRADQRGQELDLGLHARELRRDGLPLAG